LVSNSSNVLPALGTIVSSAFNGSAIFGGMMGGAFSYGVKRAVNSSGSGFGKHRQPQRHQKRPIRRQPVWSMPFPFISTWRFACVPG
ncbi:MAG: alanine:cation symporter family protein, partial [Eubacteriaceae bacterium]|nr:alanine:cation symporter family protein [Eubacteriaceae bacterium]